MENSIFAYIVCQEDRWGSFSVKSTLCFVINGLNNKMIIVLNFAKYTLNLAKWAVGLVYLVSGDIPPDFAGYLSVKNTLIIICYTGFKPFTILPSSAKYAECFTVALEGLIITLN